MRKLIIIGVIVCLGWFIFLVWVIFFPSQAYMRFRSTKVNHASIRFAESMADGILLEEQIGGIKAYSGRISFLQDDGTVHARYFKQSIRITGISGNLVWTYHRDKPALVLPTLEEGPTMENVIANCGVEPIDIEIDELGYLLITQENGEVITCDPGYGTGPVSAVEQVYEVDKSADVNMVYDNRIAQVAFEGQPISGRLLDAKIAQTAPTNTGSPRRLIIDGDLIVGFQKSLAKDSPRYLGRYSAQGVFWETPLGEGENTITAVTYCFLRGRQLIVLGYTKKSRSYAVAINIADGTINWVTPIR